jgi:hypothetical protein
MMPSIPKSSSPSAGQLDAATAQPPAVAAPTGAQMACRPGRGDEQ